MISKTRLVLVFAVCLIAALGCKSDPNKSASASGKVSYQGSPVTAGNIMFLRADGVSAGASITSDGSYSIAEMPDGEMVVTIETESAKRTQEEYTGGKSEKMKMSPPPPGKEGLGGAKGAYVKIPAKYADQKQTPLKATIKRGTNSNVDFPLTD